MQNLKKQKLSVSGKSNSWKDNTIIQVQTVEMYSVANTYFFKSETNGDFKNIL